MPPDPPWSCGSCGAPNAAYRRRCLDCGEPRTEAATPSEPAPRPAEVPGDPLERPPLARWKVVVLGLGLLGGSVGAVVYVAADRPSRSDDLAALEAALGEPGGTRVVSDDERAVGLLTRLECADLVEREATLLEEHGTAQVTDQLDGPDGASVVTYLAAFDTPLAARDHRDLVESDEVAACAFGEDGSERVVGRWWIHVVASGGEGAERARIDDVVDRVEIEG